MQRTRYVTAKEQPRSTCIRSNRRLAHRWKNTSFSSLLPDQLLASHGQMRSRKDSGNPRIEQPILAKRLPTSTSFSPMFCYCPGHGVRSQYCNITWSGQPAYSAEFPAASDGTLHPESFPILPAAIGMPLEPVVFTELRIDHPDELYGTQHYTVFARIYTAMPSTSSMSFSGVQKLYRWLDHIGQHRRCRILRYDWTSRNNEHRNEWYIIIF